MEGRDSDALDLSRDFSDVSDSNMACLCHVDCSSVSPAGVAWLLAAPCVRRTGARDLRPVRLSLFPPPLHTAERGARAKLTHLWARRSSRPRRTGRAPPAGPALAYPCPSPSPAHLHYHSPPPRPPLSPCGYGCGRAARQTPPPTTHTPAPRTPIATTVLRPVTHPRLPRSQSGALLVSLRLLPVVVVCVFPLKPSQHGSMTTESTVCQRVRDGERRSQYITPLVIPTPRLPHSKIRSGVAISFA